MEEVIARDFSSPDPGAFPTPRFDYVLTELGTLDEDQPLDESLVDKLQNHPIHDVLAECARLRPSVDIFVY